MGCREVCGSSMKNKQATEGSGEMGLGVGRERDAHTQHSELYYKRTEILGLCLFLQFVLADLHANTYKTTITTFTTIL